MSHIPQGGRCPLYGLVAWVWWHDPHGGVWQVMGLWALSSWHCFPVTRSCQPSPTYWVGCVLASATLCIPFCLDTVSATLSGMLLFPFMTCLHYCMSAEGGWATGEGVGAVLMSVSFFVFLFWLFNQSHYPLHTLFTASSPLLLGSALVCTS